MHTIKTNCRASAQNLNHTCLTQNSRSCHKQRASFATASLTTVFLLFLFAAHAVWAQANENNKAQPTLPMVELLINNQTLNVEVATTGQQRFMGLSFRPSMPEYAGMLFVYPAERPLTFTMRNTRIPLSIAFLSKDMVINEIHDMNVGPNQLFNSEQYAKFALEVNQGWFESHGIEPGMQVVVK